MQLNQPNQLNTTTEDCTAWMVNPEKYQEELEEIKQAQFWVEFQQLEIKNERQP